MTPMNPKSERPMNTPKIVTERCGVGQLLLHHETHDVVHVRHHQSAVQRQPHGGPHSPARAMYPASGSQTSAVPKIGMIVAKQVSTPQNSGLGAPKIR